MQTLLRKKILLITGASSDIGVNFIEQYHQDYDIIVSHYNTSNETIMALKSKIGNKIIPVQADFTNAEDTNNFLNFINSGEYVPTHILYLSAQKFEYKNFHKIKWDTFENAINSSLRTCAMISKACLPSMKKNKYGKIVFMLSKAVTATEAPAFASVYTSTKYALLGLMKTLSSEYKKFGININGISPAYIDTKYVQDHSDLIVENVMKATNQNRKLTPTEVSQIINFLLSDDASCVTGQNIELTV